jgi:pilus assembly protein CpaC
MPRGSFGSGLGWAIAAIAVAAALAVSAAHANGIDEAVAITEVEDAAALASYGDGDLRAVKLGLNKAIVIDLPRDARDVLISNPAIADAVMRTPRRIYLTGVAIGQANIIVFDRAGAEIVSLDLEVERDNSMLERTLARLIPGSNIIVEVVNDNIVLSGTVRTANDSRRAQDLAAIFANGGANVATAAGGASSTSTGGGNSVSISLGSQPAPTSSVVNMLAIEGEDQVHIKVTVAEIQRSVAKQLGVNMNGAISVGSFKAAFNSDNPFALTGQPLSDTNGVVGDGNRNAGIDTFKSGIFAQLRALEQTGMIKTLAEPTLTAISGESASFLAGGEFPVPTNIDPDTGLPSIEYKPFGVSLSFTPVVLSEGRISLHVKTEASELSSEGAVSLGNISVPSLKVRRAESTLELPSGGAMVLGGLLQDSIRQSISGVPALKDVPVLGALFRSRDFQRAETELVIIVTPFLVSPVSRDALALPTDGFAPAGDPSAIFLGRINRVYGVEGKPAPAGSYRGTIGFIFE